VKINVTVKDQAEGELLREGLADLEVRAFVLVVGALKRLPTNAARQYALAFISEMLAAENRELLKTGESE